MVEGLPEELVCTAGRDLAEHMYAVLEDKSAVVDWYYEEHVVEGRSPHDLCMSGEQETVWELLDRMEDNVYS